MVEWLALYKFDTHIAGLIFLWWAYIVLQCLYEAGKGDQIRLLDLLCEALDPATYNCRISDTCTKVEKDPTGSSNDSWHQQYPLSRRDHFICQAIRKVRYVI